VLQELRESLDRQVPLVVLEPREVQELRVLRELLGRQVLRELLGRQEPRDPQERQVAMELGRQDRREPV
jgi:hypothetical protein